MSDGRRRLVIATCWTVSAALFVIAGAWLLFGEDKGNGIFALIVAVLASRILVLDTAERLGGEVPRRSPPEEPDDAS